MKRLVLVLPFLLIAANCPMPDRDGDGVPDVIDQCPDVPGPVENLGCPITPPEGYDCANQPALSGFIPVANPIEGRYIVVRKPAARLSVASASGFAARFNAQEVQYLNATTLSLRVAKDKLSALVSDPEVQYVQQEGRKSTRLSWGLDRVDDREGRDGKYTPLLSGTGVHAYINDTGISPHPDFEDRLSSDCFSTIVLKGCEDGHGHGTHVAGTIGGKTWGVAKKVILHSARFLDSNGSGTDSDAIKSLDWIAAHQLPEGERGVVNASWGGSPAPAVDAAVCRVIESGKVFVAAAGNESADSRSSTPARIVQVVTVGAMDRDDRGASFSNFGPGVDLFAPGVDIESTAPGGGTATYSGTSMASPHVAGGAALYLEAHRSATVAEVEAGLIAESTPDTLSGIGEGSPNRLLYVLPKGLEPPEPTCPEVCPEGQHCVDPVAGCVPKPPEPPEPPEPPGPVCEAGTCPFDKLYINAKHGAGKYGDSTMRCRDRAYCEKATGIPGTADCALGTEATAQRLICELAHAPGCHRWFYQSTDGSWQRCMPEPGWASCDHFDRWSEGTVYLGPCTKDASGAPIAGWQTIPRGNTYFRACGAGPTAAVCSQPVKLDQ